MMAWPDADLVRMLSLFTGRPDTYARMWQRQDGSVGYSPVQAPLTPAVLARHLSGEVTIGTYLIRPDETVTTLVLDLDAEKHALAHTMADRDRLAALRMEIHTEGLRLLSALEDLGCAPLLVDSGHKGRHLWIFLEDAAPAAEAHAAAQRLAHALRPESPRLRLEAFPRQPRLTGKALGNLIKFPLGVHLRSGRRAVFLDRAGVPLPNPAERLRQITRTPLSALAVLPEAPEAPPRPVPPPAPAWAEGDFDRSPQVALLLKQCPLLAGVIEETLAGGALKRDDLLVLKHTIGHLEAGPAAVNYLLGRVSGSSERMKRRLRGSPMSCERLRSRLPRLSDRCRQCPFPEDTGDYPHPLRHLSGSPPAPPPDPAVLLQRLHHQRARLSRIQAELAGIEATCLHVLQPAPGAHVVVEGQRWGLTDGRLVLLGEEE